MGTQSNDRGGEKQQTPQRPGEPRKQGQGPERPRQAQDQGDQEPRFMTSDDDVAGEMDADAEVDQPEQAGNQDRERSGSTRSRNP